MQVYFLIRAQAFLNAILVCTLFAVGLPLSRLDRSRYTRVLSTGTRNSSALLFRLTFLRVLNATMA